jgi:hypothetical protein
MDNTLLSVSLSNTYSRFNIEIPIVLFIIKRLTVWIKIRR